MQNTNKLYLEHVITNKYRGLLRVSRNILNEAGVKEVRKAFNLAYAASKSHKTINEEPYINHCIAIARICVEEIGLGRSSIVSSLLFSFVQTKQISIETVRENFGDIVVAIIKDLTKISGIESPNNSEQSENFRRLLLSLVTDVRVILIKLAERLQIMRSLESFPSSLQLSMATETFFLYAPLGHRLGLYNLKSEFEDISLRYTDPDAYHTISKKLEETATARNKFIKEFIQPIILSVIRAQI